MLDKIRKNRIKSSLAIALSTFIAAMILWPLMDLGWHAWFTHTEFHYTLKDYLLEPAIFAVIFGLISYFAWKPETKREKAQKSKTK